MSAHHLKRQRLLLRRNKIRMWLVVAISFASMPLLAPISLVAWFFLITPDLHGNAPLMGVGYSDQN